MIDKSMILVPDLNGFFESEDNSKIYSLYKTNKLWHRIIRKIILKYQLPGKSILFSHWLNEVETSDKIIIFDTGNQYYISRYIKKKYPSVRIIIWYWNSISDSIPIQKSDYVEHWSFDISDCRKYDINYNTQFYTSSLFRIDNTKICNFSDHIFYVGKDKNRSKILGELKSVFDKQGINYRFNLVKDKQDSNDYGIVYSPPMKYSDVLIEIANCKAVIDIVSEWQDGITLRPLEALYFRKKLITNQKSIKEHPFYSKNNIFIIGEDSYEELYDFLQMPYEDADRESLIKYYSFKEWLSRFS